jgi:hypothetical protein
MRLREFSSEVNMIPFIYKCGEESCILLKLATRQNCFSILVYVSWGMGSTERQTAAASRRIRPTVIGVYTMDVVVWFLDQISGWAACSAHVFHQV